MISVDGIEITKGIQFWDETRFVLVGENVNFLLKYNLGYLNFAKVATIEIEEFETIKEIDDRIKYLIKNEELLNIDSIVVYEIKSKSLISISTKITKKLVK